MKIKVIAKSDRHSFVGADPEGSFCVFTLDDTVDIEVGDVLRGVFDDSNGLSKWVQNETQDQRVYICAETWGASKHSAFEMLERIGGPTKIWVQ